LDDPLFSLLRHRQATHPGGLSPGLPLGVPVRAGGAPLRKPAPPRGAVPEEGEPLVLPAIAIESGPEPEPKPVVKLFNPRWDRERARSGAHAMASVEAEIPSSCAHLTRVVFSFHACLADGKLRAMVEKDAHLREGRAEVRFDLPTEEADGRGYIFFAKHARSENLRSPKLATEDGVEEDAVKLMFFSPARNQYLVLATEEDVKDWMNHIAEMEALRGKTLQAWQILDPAKRLVTLDEVGKKAEELFGEKGTTARTKSGLEELLLMADNRRDGDAPSWVYVNRHARRDGTPVSGAWRGHGDATVRKQLDKLLKRTSEERKNPWFKTQVKMRLFKAEVRSGQAWGWRLPEKEPRPGGPRDEPRFEFTGDAAALRYMAGWDGGEVSFDPKKKKVHVGTSVNAALSLFEGKLSGKWLWPDADGIDIIRFLRNEIGVGKALRQGLECRLRTSVEVSGSTFAGFSLTGSLAFPALDFSKGWAKTSAEAGAGVSGFLGIQAAAGVKVALDWSPSRAVAFKALASVGGELSATAGLAGEAKLKVEWKGGRFRFQCSWGLAVGLGGKEQVTFDLSVNEGRDLLMHLCHCVDHHYLEEISAEAFAVLEEQAYALITRTTGPISRGWRYLKAVLRESAGLRTTLRGMPPAALARVLLDLMRMPEQEDFRAVLLMLNACSPSQLLWTLRSLSGMDLSGFLDPDYEERKASACGKGKLLLLDFGKGIPGLEQARLRYVEELRSLYYSKGA
jgi:hypothetical protein